MTTPKRRSNTEKFEEHARKILLERHDELEQPTFADMRKSYYFFKLIDSWWFEGDLPEDPDKEITFINNPDWPDSVYLPPNMDGFERLSESEIRYICNRLEMPGWVMKHRARQTRTFNLTTAFIRTIRIMIER